MQEELHCKISQFIDDDLAVDEALDLLQQIIDDPGLEAKLYRYQIASQALKADLHIPPDAHFVKRVSRQIERENIHFLPHKLHLKKKSKTLLAVAASVAIVTVIILGGLSQTLEQDIPALQMAASVDTGKQHQNDQRSEVSAAQPYPIDPQYYDYLEAHQGILYPPDPHLPEQPATGSNDAFPG